MNQASLVVIDDFYFAPKALARVAQSLDYSVKEHEGHKYNGVSTDFEPEKIVGLMSLNLGRNVQMGINLFRLGTAVEKATTHVHADNSMDPFAAVLYLSEAPAGVSAGTAFWRHKKYQIEQMPTAEWIVANVGPDVQAFITEINTDGNDESKWELTSLVGQRFNRFVTYPSHWFHSRYPQNAWGETPKDGRLIWTGFYRFAD